MKKYNFHKFNRENILGDTRISLTRASALRFSSGFYKANSLSEYKYVALFFDKENEAIGIQLTNKPEKGAFKITTEGKNGAGSVSIVSFLKVNKIDPKLYHGRYDWHKETIEGIGEIFIIDLVINLDEIPF